MKSRRDERRSRDKRSSHYKPKAYSLYENDKRHMKDLEDKERDRVGKKGHFVNQNESSSNYSSESENDRPKLPKAYSGGKRGEKEEKAKRTSPRNFVRTASPEVKEKLHSSKRNEKKEKKGSSPTRPEVNQKLHSRKRNEKKDKNSSTASPEVKEKLHSRKRNEKKEKKSSNDDQKNNSRRKNTDLSPSRKRKERHSEMYTNSRSRSNSREKVLKFIDHRSISPREIKRTQKQDKILKTQSQSNDSADRKSRLEERKSNHKHDRHLESHSHYSSSTKYKNNVHDKRVERSNSTETGILSKSRTENRNSDVNSVFQENVGSGYPRRRRSQSQSISKSPSPERVRRKRKLSMSDSGSTNSESKIKKIKRKKKKKKIEKEDTDSEENSLRKKSLKKKLKKKEDKKKKKKDKHNKKKHKDKRKKRKKEKDEMSKKFEKSAPSLSSVQEKLLAIAGVEVDKSTKKTSHNRAPMSKDEYDRQQSKLRRVLDPDTGRMSKQRRGMDSRFRDNWD